jgi:hypothetical protein
VALADETGSPFGGGGAARPPYARPGSANNTDSPQPAQPAPPAVQPGQVIAPAIPQAGLPATTFSPTDATIHDMEIWAHDETVLPGHTYRYMIKLSMKNPLFASVNVAKNPADTLKFAIEAQSDWTSPVSIPVSTHFFVTNVGMLNQVVQLEMDTWAAGRWTATNMKLVPGDPIPGTGWAIVDTRPQYTRDDPRAIVRDDQGRLVTRTAKQDQVDPLHEQLKRIIQQQPPAAADATR